MSSWKYAFLFPRPSLQLRPERSLSHLTKFGAEFGDFVRLCVPIDDTGHLLDVGEEVRLRMPFDQDICRKLEARISFSAELQSMYLPFSLHFLLASPNPHIFIGWPSRLFAIAPLAFQQDFWKGVRLFARDCNAAYVVVVDDAPDHFEDRFLEIDGKRVFDLEVTHRYGINAREVWIRSDEEAMLPEGVTYGITKQIGDGFESHSIAR